MAQKRSLNVAIIGAGMSGLCMAAKLQDAGIDTYTIFEKADEVGGTWRDNTYPGLTCDVPSRFYSYTFRPNPDWSHLFPPGAEIHAYFRQFATERGIYRHIRFGADVSSARFEMVAGGWPRLRVRKSSTSSSQRPVFSGCRDTRTFLVWTRSPVRCFTPHGGIIRFRCPTSESG